MPATVVWQYRAPTAARTRQLAQTIAPGLSSGAVLALAGELGAGKTTLVQGLAAGLGVFDLRQVLSPTYALVNEYPGPTLTLVHIDFYRLDTPDAAQALGLPELIGRTHTVTAIEWADQLPQLVPSSAAWIRLRLIEGGERELEITGLAPPPELERQNRGRPDSGADSAD